MPPSKIILLHCSNISDSALLIVLERQKSSKTERVTHVTDVQWLYSDCSRNYSIALGLNFHIFLIGLLVESFSPDYTSTSYDNQPVVLKAVSKVCMWFGRLEACFFVGCGLYIFILLGQLRRKHPVNTQIEKKREDCCAL